MNKYEKKNREAIKKRKRKVRRRRILAVFLFLLVIIGSAAGYILYQTYNAAKESYTEIENRIDGKSELREEPVHISNDPVSILLLGIENYTDEYDRGRSDTIMVATFNPSDQTMKLLSIPRDTRVKIGDLGYKDKINHSYSEGGKELTIETVEGFLDIPIDYFVTVNFDGFISIVDLLGGVTVDVPFDFNDINAKWERFYFTEGEMELDGEEALVYARMRKKDPRGDFGRNDRQKQIVTSVIDKLSSPKTITKIDDIAKEIGKNVETNIKIREAIAFRQKFADFNSSRIEQLALQGYDLDINSIYYFDPDDQNLEEIQTELKQHLELLPPETNETTYNEKINKKRTSKRRFFSYFSSLNNSGKIKMTIFIIIPTRKPRIARCVGLLLSVDITWTSLFKTVDICIDLSLSFRSYKNLSFDISSSVDAFIFSISAILFSMSDISSPWTLLLSFIKP